MRFVEMQWSKRRNQIIWLKNKKNNWLSQAIIVNSYILRNICTKDASDEEIQTKIAKYLHGRKWMEKRQTPQEISGTGIAKCLVETFRYEWSRLMHFFETLVWLYFNTFNGIYPQLGIIFCTDNCHIIHVGQAGRWKLFMRWKSSRGKWVIRVAGAFGNIRSLRSTIADLLVVPSCLKIHRSSCLVAPKL